MANLTIYLPDELAARARKAARGRRLSVSRWVAEQVTEKLASDWTPEFLAALGSCPDFPEQEELRRGYGADSVREKWD